MKSMLCACLLALLAVSTAVNAHKADEIALQTAKKTRGHILF